MADKSTMLNFIERIAEKRPEQITPKERGQIEKAIQKLSGNNPNIDLVCNLKAKLAETALVQEQMIAGGKRKTRRRRRKQRKTRRR